MAGKSTYARVSAGSSAGESVCSVRLDCDPKTILMGLAAGIKERGSPSELAVLRLPGSQGRFACVGSPTPSGGAKGPGLRLLESDGRTEWNPDYPYPLPQKGARLLLVEALRESPKRGFQIPVEFLDEHKRPICSTKVTAKVVKADIFFESALARRTRKSLCSATLRMKAQGKGLNGKDFNFKWSFPRGAFDNSNSIRPTLTAATEKTPAFDRDLVVLEVSMKDDPTCKVRISRPLNITTPDSVVLRGSATRRQTTRLNLNNFSSPAKRRGTRRLFGLRVRYTIVDQFGSDINDSYVGRNRRVVKIREQVEGNLTVYLPNNTGNDIRVNNTPRFVKPSTTGRINDLLQATFSKGNLVSVVGGRVRFAIATAGADCLTLKPHPWFVAIGDRQSDAVLNQDQVTNNDLRCFVESVGAGGRQLDIRTNYVVTVL